MLDAIERIRAATSLPLAAQPNAGIPRSVEGRNIYLCSPEYMASYARKFVTAGVRLVGGCCGTTPEHIRVMKSALRVSEARGTRRLRQVPQHAGTSPVAACHSARATVAARAQRLPRGEFVTMVEIVPPKGTDIHKELEGREVPEIGGRGCDQYSRQPARLGAHEQPGAVAADAAAGRDRSHPALHLPRPQCALHSVGPAGRGRDRHPQFDLHHRRSAEDGRTIPTRRQCSTWTPSVW